MAKTELNEPITDAELDEPGVFWKISPEEFDEDTPRRPYMTFQTTPGDFEHLVIKIWSHDQGWCSGPNNVGDPYENSWTWFALGVVSEDGKVLDEHLFDFQTNVRASDSLACHTNEWRIGAPGAGEDVDDESLLDGFLESLACPPAQEIGIFPLARYKGWKNSVVMMEVQIKHHRTVAGKEELIYKVRLAINAMPLHHQHRPAWLYVLAGTLATRYGETIQDLEEAVALGRRAVAIADPDSHLRWTAVIYLEQLLATYYERTKAVEALEEAISLTMEVIAAIPDDGGEQPEAYRHLGQHFDKRFRLTHAIKDRDRSTECFHLALRCSGGIHDRVRAAHLVSTNFILTSTSDKKYWASQTSGIAADATAIALHFGRGPLLAHPELAAKWESVSRRLAEPVSQHDQVDAHSVSSLMDQRHLDIRYLTQLLDEIRKKDDTDVLFQGMKIDGVYQVAARGPVVMLNVSVHRCDALIIQPSAVKDLPLLNLSLGSIWARINDIQSMTTLEWLWDDIVEPVLDALGYTGYVVAVSMQETPDMGPLIHTDDEINAVRQTCGIFHFAGHGWAAKDPLQSRLCLQDWKTRPLTVERLIETDFSSSLPFLAYLSACGTGKNSEHDSADESVHLAGMFQLAGFRHVVGTLWDVDDQVCVDMATMIYESLGVNGINDGAVSLGLHHATRALRERWRREQSAAEALRKRDITMDDDGVLKAPPWVPYVHFGV
ncbi:CHAT domain-containing protein [Hirsutella rhossiliensis]|uniref:CHAT domain-containing protein n=1 Tax=Hirsutella rhossiliensis TaxID=111463 RepID=A0A9P8MNG1_9HYPO|nr:CHAT domain-containing protein [Hirsutella rhossiliensis]KAH0957221.1 CHAT domain-containing protein [Hirsutella rhossiliensis]